MHFGCDCVIVQLCYTSHSDPRERSLACSACHAGTFQCAGCGAPVFSSGAKFNSGTGWPSFYQALPNAVAEVPDLSIFFLPRTEVRCRRCQSHLGHVFKDGPEPTGLRYCMNGLALMFQAQEV
jgi:peptide-methionine (R)-S-oxide reductase